MTSRDKQKLRILGVRYARESVKYHNGDPHPRVSAAASKADHSEAWGRNAEKTAASFTKYAEGLGLTVSFNGLQPSVELEGLTLPIYG